MRVIYLTTAVEEENYDYFLKNNLRVSNPSNQNFHHLLIESLRLAFPQLEVLSLVPFKTTKPLLDNPPFRYVNHPRNLIDKLITKGVILDKINYAKTERHLIIYDSLNVRLGQAASSLKKKKNVVLVPILTDNPHNLSSASYLYKRNVFLNAAKSDGAIALSNGLLEAFGLSNKPSFITEGIVERREKKDDDKATNRPYIYFGGALLKRYGLKDLLEAYEENKPDYDLLIAGHLGDSPLPSDERIRYLGQVSRKENYAWQEKASLLINPRPFDKTLDKESVPSKMLEYLASGTPIISTVHTRLKELFPQDVNWIENSTLSQYLAAHLDENKKLINLKENKSAQKLYELYGVESLAKRLQLFLNDLSSSSKESMTFAN